jgi:hypothetical protein
MLKAMKASLTSLRLRILAIVLLCWLVPALLLGGYMGGVIFDALQQKTEAALTESAGHAQTLTVQAIRRAITQAKDVTYDGELSTTYADYAAGRLYYAGFTASAATISSASTGGTRCSCSRRIIP